MASDNLIIYLVICFLFFQYSRQTINRISELNFAVTRKLEPEVVEGFKHNPLQIKDKARGMLAKSYFDVKEYSR